MATKANFKREQIGKGRTQAYQVWAWNENVSRLTTLGVKKGSFLWLFCLRPYLRRILRIWNGM